MLARSSTRWIRPYMTGRVTIARSRAFWKELGVNLSLKDVPEPAKLLGFAGTIPFLGSAWLMAQGSLPAEDLAVIRHAQLSYSACILSFMGAVHWGLEMSRYGAASSALTVQRYTLSVVPSLVAASSLCMPYSACYITQLLAFNGLLYADIKAHSRRLVPAWYPGLRVYLTGVVTLTLGVSFVADAYRRFTTTRSKKIEPVSEEEAR